MRASETTVEERSPSKPSAIEGCPECGGRTRAEDRETYCPECGLVVYEDDLNRGPEWRWFEDNSRERTRIGAPLTIARHDRGLSSEIGFASAWNGPESHKFERLRREHFRARYRSKADRNLADALGQIARLVGALELSYSVRERSSAIYRDLQGSGMLTGRSIDTLTAASVYAACRCAGIVRTTDEIAAAAQCSQHELETGYRLLNRELGLGVPVVDIHAYVSRVLSAVNAVEAVRVRAFELAKRTEVESLSTGCHPGGIAAACVYHAGHEHGQLYTQQMVAEAASVTINTVRKRWYELRELAD